MLKTRNGEVIGNAGHVPGRLLNEHEVAARLGLQVTTLRRWRWAGKGPAFVRIGSAVRYDPADLASFIDAGRRRSTSDPGEAA